jgi:DNA-binding response OmpR family regulator
MKLPHAAAIVAVSLTAFACTVDTTDSSASSQRGTAPADAPSRLASAELSIDRTRRRAWLASLELVLTPREFDLLWHFMGHPGRAFTRAELLEQVWGYGHDGYDHTVNSHINRLRAKLGDDRSESRFIHTVWGVGYRFEVAEAS